MLAVLVTTLDVVRVLRRVTAVETEEFVPVVRDGNKLWVNECAKVRNNAGQRIVEVLVFSASETMSFHHDAAAEKVVAFIKAGYPFAFIRGKELFDNRVAFRVEIFCNVIPVDCRHCAGRSHFVLKTTRTARC